MKRCVYLQAIVTGRLIVSHISQRDVVFHFMFYSSLPQESDAFIKNSHFAVSTVDIEIKIEVFPLPCNFKLNFKANSALSFLYGILVP